MSGELYKVFLNDFHKEHNAKFAPFAGYSMPINYDQGILKEHTHVRNLVGLFDVSHMGQILISNSIDNIKYIEKFIPLNFEKLQINKSNYSFILNENGGIIDDIIVSKIIYSKKEYFFIVYNASRKKIDEDIFKSNLTDYRIITNHSLIAIQGPLSFNAISFLDVDDDMIFMSIKSIFYDDHELIISRSGYTGEDGFEISIPNILLKKIIKKIINFNDIILCGLGCRDTLRLEAGLSLYGNDLTEEITPIESKLSWAIDESRLKANNFNGSNIIIDQINMGVKKIKIGIKTTSKSILRNQMKILNINNNEIGYITSGSFSPTLKTSIALAYIDNNYINDKIFCIIRDKVEEMKVVNLPFVSHKYRRQ